MSLLSVAALLFAAACASPAETFDKSATDLGFRRSVVMGTDFRHVVYAKEGSSADELHVYLDGDGTPWLRGRPAADPTPRNPLVLRLMALDPAPAIYLGRPCYHGSAGGAACRSDIWTSRRYSEEIVTSMAAALRGFLAQRDAHRIAFFGYSGGGTLAVLLCERLPESTVVVTIAANLDVAAWAQYHGYRPLEGSLNPALQPPLPPTIRQFHYVGEKDDVVPAALIARAAEHLGGRLTVVPGFDHRCCWEQLWPDILANVDESPGQDVHGSSDPP